MSLMKLQGGAPNGGGDFLGRIQWDARGGAMSAINREQGALGWENVPAPLGQPFCLAMDLGNIEMVWMRLVNGVDVQGVKASAVISGDAEWIPRPSEDHKEGFRVQVSNSKLFTGLREWSSTAFCVRDKIDEIHEAWMAASGHADEVPLVTFTGRIASVSGKGTNYGPEMSITGWTSRDAFDTPTLPIASHNKTNPMGKALRQPPIVEVQSIPAPANAVEFA